MQTVSVTIVGLAGGTCSGKTTIASRLADRIGADRVSLLAFDAFYHDLSHLTPQERSSVNYDHPDALDTGSFIECLDALRSGRPASVPVYDFATHTRPGDVHHTPAREIVITEGILLLCFPEIRTRLDVSVFLDVGPDDQLARRIERDVLQRGRAPDDVRRQFDETVRPMHDTFVGPSASEADLVVDSNRSLDAATDEVFESLTARHPLH